MPHVPLPAGIRRPGAQGTSTVAPFVRAAGPGRAKAAGKALPGRIARLGEGMDLLLLTDGDLADDVRGGAEAVQAQPARRGAASPARRQARKPIRPAYSAKPPSRS